MNDFKIIEVKPKIFLFSFKDYYDMGMHFLRYQEFYESPSKEFRGKAFKILDFMKWYSKKYGKGAFTYPQDWAGYNFYSNIIKKVWDLGIPDVNGYDLTMKKAYDQCNAKYDDSYIIGAVGKGTTLKHEIAHGFFYLDSDYKKEMTSLVMRLDPDFRNSMKKTLKEMGYTPSVYIDEIQAYLSTGLTSSFTVNLNDEDKPFKKLYKEYNGKK